MSDKIRKQIRSFVSDASDDSQCPGCKSVLPSIDGPTHDYMESSPACFRCFTTILASEYGDQNLLATHRLTVDTYAVQHPGRQVSRTQIQSVGLHLARLGLQVNRALPPMETNNVMLGLGKHKNTLKPLKAPERFSMTASHVVEFAGSNRHSDMVREWATLTWNDWADYHDYITSWTNKWL